MINLRQAATPLNININNRPLELAEEADIANSSQFGRGWASASMNEEGAELLWKSNQAAIAGDTALAQGLRQQGEDVMRRAQAWAPTVQNFTDIQGPGDLVDWAGGAAGNIRSSVMPALGGLAGGVVGGLGGLAVGGLPGAAAGATWGARTGAGLAGYDTMTASNAAQSMMDPTIAATRTPEEIRDVSRLTGAAQGALEAIVPAGMATSIVKGAGKKAAQEIAEQGAKKYIAKKAGKEGGEEFATEFLQNPIGDIGQNYLAGNDMTDVDWKAAFNAGMAGFAPGAMMGGVGATADLMHDTVGGAAEKVADVVRDPVGAGIDKMKRGAEAAGAEQVGQDPVRDREMAGKMYDHIYGDKGWSEKPATLRGMHEEMQAKAQDDRFTSPVSKDLPDEQVSAGMRADADRWAEKILTSPPRTYGPHESKLREAAAAYKSNGDWATLRSALKEYNLRKEQEDMSASFDKDGVKFSEMSPYLQADLEPGQRASTIRREVPKADKELVTPPPNLMDDTRRGLAYTLVGLNDDTLKSKLKELGLTFNQAAQMRDEAEAYKAKVDYKRKELGQRLTPEGEELTALSDAWLSNEGKGYSHFFDDSNEAKGLGAKLFGWIKADFGKQYNDGEMFIPKAFVDALGKRAPGVIESAITAARKEGWDIKDAGDAVKTLREYVASNEGDVGFLKGAIRYSQEKNWSQKMIQQFAKELRQKQGRIDKEDYKWLKSQVTDPAAVLQHFQQPSGFYKADKNQLLRSGSPKTQAGMDVDGESLELSVDRDGEVVSESSSASAGITDNDGDWGSSVSEFDGDSKPTFIGNTLEGYPFDTTDERQVAKKNAKLGEYANDPAAFAREIGVWQQAKRAAKGDKKLLAEYEDALIREHGNSLSDARFEGELNPVDLTDGERDTILGLINKRFRVVEVETTKSANDMAFDKKEVHLKEADPRDQELGPSKGILRFQRYNKDGSPIARPFVTSTQMLIGKMFKSKDSLTGSTKYYEGTAQQLLQHLSDGVATLLQDQSFGGEGRPAKIAFTVKADGTPRWVDAKDVKSWPKNVVLFRDKEGHQYTLGEALAQIEEQAKKSPKEMRNELRTIDWNGVYLSHLGDTSEGAENYKAAVAKARGKVKQEREKVSSAIYGDNDNLVRRLYEHYAGMGVIPKVPSFTLDFDPDTLNPHNKLTIKEKKPWEKVEDLKRLLDLSTDKELRGRIVRARKLAGKREFAESNALWKELVDSGKLQAAGIVTDVEVGRGNQVDEGQVGPDDLSAYDPDYIKRTDEGRMRSKSLEYEAQSVIGTPKKLTTEGSSVNVRGKAVNVSSGVKSVANDKAMLDEKRKYIKRDADGNLTPVYPVNFSAEKLQAAKDWVASVMLSGVEPLLAAIGKMDLQQVRITEAALFGRETVTERNSRVSDPNVSVKKADAAEIAELAKRVGVSRKVALAMLRREEKTVYTRVYDKDIGGVRTKDAGEAQTVTKQVGLLDLHQTKLAKQYFNGSLRDALAFLKSGQENRSVVEAAVAKRKLELKKGSFENPIVGDIWAQKGYVVVSTNLGGVHGRGLAKQAKDKGLISSQNRDFDSSPNDKKVLLVAVKGREPSTAKLEGRAFSEQVVGKNVDLLKAEIAKVVEFAKANPNEKIYLPYVGLGFGEGNVSEIGPILAEAAFVPNIFMVTKDESTVQKYAESFKPGVRRDATTRADAGATTTASDGKLVDAAKPPAFAKAKEKEGNTKQVVVNESPASGYRDRTKHNADSADVTIAFAADHGTAGERLTARLAGDKLVKFEKSAKEFAEAIVAKLKSVNGTSINVAGNGIYTWAKYGKTQEQINEAMFKILKTVKGAHPKLNRIVTGGQTGSDIAGAIAARALGIPVEVTMPRGFLQRGTDGKDFTQTREDVLRQIEDGAAALERVVSRAATRVNAGGDMKFSMMSTEIHNSLGKSGFAATHDSPIRHGGWFNWRKFIGLGEGNASFGAGTYLSTADGVHKSYKSQFTAKIKFGIGSGIGGFIENPNKIDPYVQKFNDVAMGLMNDPDLPTEVWVAFSKAFEESIPTTRVLRGDRETTEYLGKSHMKPFDKKIIEEISGWDSSVSDWMTNFNNALSGAPIAKTKGFRSDASPTYEVTVNIKPEQLLDWDAPLSEQSEFVQKALRNAKPGAPVTKWVHDGKGTYTGEDGFSIVQTNHGFLLLEHGETDFGTFGTLDAAKAEGASVIRDIREARGLFDEKKPNDYGIFSDDEMWVPYYGTTGEQVYKQLARKLGSQAKASDYLQSLGILGHKYAASGGRNDKHPNYVIYDDSKIETNYVHFNKQGSNNPLTEPMKPDEAVAYLERVFGKDFDVEVVESLGGHAGLWTPHGIMLATSAVNGVQYHEALHEFFSQLRKHGSESVAQLIERVATNPIIMRKLEQLLEGHPKALKQLKTPEEAAAFMFQFWNMGLINIGPETKTLFQTIKDFIAKVAKKLLSYVDTEFRDKYNAEKRADKDKEMALLAFETLNSGLVADPSRRQEVYDALRKNVEAHNKAMDDLGSGVEKFWQKLGQVVVSNEAMLGLYKKHPELQALASKFHQTHGKSMVNQGREGGPEARGGYLEATHTQSGLWLNKLENILDGYDQKDMELALKYLEEGTGNSADAKIAKLVNGIRGFYGEMYDYTVQSDVRRLDPTSELRWVPVDKRKDYFTQVWDTEAVMGGHDKFIEKLLTIHPKELKHMADQANAEIAAWRKNFDDSKLSPTAKVEVEKQKDAFKKSGKIAGKYEFAEITPEAVAETIYTRLLNSAGLLDMHESEWSLGITPGAAAVNRRELNWLDKEAFSEFKSKDLVNITTTYARSMVKRAEYQKRFGYGGELIGEAVDTALLRELGGNELVKESRLALGWAIKAWKKEAAGWHKDNPGVPYPEPYPTLRMVGIELHRNNVGVDAANEALIKAEKELRPAINAIKGMEGTLGADISPAMRNFNSWVTSYQNVRLLPFMLFTNLSDVIGITVQGGTLGDAWNAFVEGMREIRATWKGEKSNTDLQRRAQEWGVVDAGALLDSLGQAYGSVFMSQKAKRFNDKFFRIIGAEGWNRGIRATAANVGERIILDWVKDGVDFKKPGEKERFERLYGEGATAKSIKLDSSGNLDVNNAANRAAINRFVADAIMTSNAAHRTAWMSNPKFATFSHLKNFAYTFHRVMLLNILDQARLGNFRPALVASLGYAPIAIAAGAIKEMLIPGEEPPWMQGGLDGYLEYGYGQANLGGVAQLWGETITDLDPAKMAGPFWDQIQNTISSPLPGIKLNLSPIDGETEILRDREWDVELAKALPAGNVLGRAFKG